MGDSFHNPSPEDVAAQAAENALRSSQFVASPVADPDPYDLPLGVLIQRWWLRRINGN